MHVLCHILANLNSCAYQACLVAYWTKSHVRQVCISDQLGWMSDWLVYHVGLHIRQGLKTAGLHIRLASYMYM